MTRRRHTLLRYAALATFVAAMSALASLVLSQNLATQPVERLTELALTAVACVSVAAFVLMRR